MKCFNDRMNCCDALIYARCFYADKEKSLWKKWLNFQFLFVTMVMIMEHKIIMQNLRMYVQNWKVVATLCFDIWNSIFILRSYIKTNCETLVPLLKGEILPQWLLLIIIKHPVQIKVLQIGLSTEVQHSHVIFNFLRLFE